MVLTCWIYSQQIRFMLRLIYLLQYKHVVSSVTLLQLSKAYTGRILLLEKHLRLSLIVKNVFEGAKRQLVTPIEKRDPLLLICYLNCIIQFSENNLMSQRIISSYLLPFARFLRVSELLYIKRSDIIFESCYVSIFIPKSKTDIYRDRNTVVISRMDNNLCPVKKIRKVFIVSECFAKFR